MVKHPFGPASVVTVTAGATVNLAVENSLTYVKQSAAMAANTTFNVTATNAALENGSELLIELPSDGTGRSFTPGTGMTGLAIAGTANQTIVARFLMVNGSFVHVGQQRIA